MTFIASKALSHAVSFGLVLAGIGLMQEAPVMKQPVMAQTQPRLNTAPLEAMTPDRLEELLQSEGVQLQGGDGQWEVILGDRGNRSVLVLANEAQNRMRILTPIMGVSELSPQQVQAMMVANFHTTLDARYAVTEGTVVSVFVHPLSSLQANDLRSALRQVVSLAETFGSSYSSSELLFDQTAPNRSEPPTQLEARLLL